jgi:hypothetical protein
MTREEQQLGVDASTAPAAQQAPPTCTTQECIYNTELIKHTSAAQRQSTKRQQA